MRATSRSSLHLHHFRQDGGRWWIVFGGKGKKGRRLKVHDTLFQSLGAWLLAARISWEGDGPLFRSFDRGDHLTSRAIDPSAVGRLVTHCGHVAGLAPATGKNQLSMNSSRPSGSEIQDPCLAR
ncbi:MAG: hypothetical protein HGA45_12525 [Chloroflexales bacterium]|nr:hypothetical protein [Chloroflexales bacterium]